MFDTGRSLIVAFDHGTEGAIPGGEDFPAMLATIGASEADGVLLTTAACRHFDGWRTSHGSSMTSIAGLDIPIFGTRVSDSDTLATTRMAWSPKHAQDAGAAMTKLLLPLGLTNVTTWADALQSIAGVATESRRIGLPIMIEPVFWGPQPEKSDAAIADAARLCVELGADVIKLPGTADRDMFTKIVRWSPVPVVVQGGSLRSGREMLASVLAWLNDGATGVVIGRNIWNRPNAAAAIAAFSSVTKNLDLGPAEALMEQAGEPLSLNPAS